MDNKSVKNKRIGITAGVICFLVLYIPLLDVLIRYYQGWNVSLENFITKLLVAMIVTAFISFFLGYSVTKKDSRLTLISSLIAAVAFIAVLCIFSLSTHAFN